MPIETPTIRDVLEAYDAARAGGKLDMMAPGEWSKVLAGALQRADSLGENEQKTGLIVD